MRQLKDYSTEDNLKYLKREYEPIYSCLKKMVTKATTRFIQYQDKIDERDEFELLLATLKSHFPHGVAQELKSSKVVYQLDAEDNLKPLANIFETLILDGLDKHEFNSLDPEIQDLYLEAQKEIDR